MTSRIKKRRFGFRTRELRVRRGPPASHYLSKPMTFWIAVMSLFAFVAGNMLGQHGQYFFWYAMWAQMDDSVITYNGTVSPIPLIPDPILWAKYGGDQRYNTFAQAPKDILIKYPSYIPLTQIAATDVLRHRLYSQDFDDADHPDHSGIDMTAPQGTPVVAAMNGLVTKVAFEAGGFGNYIILSSPNSPDPRNPGKTTKIYTLYAHLDSTLATEGSAVNKGEVIGAVGKTGNAGGFHLHFQSGYDEKMLWPFSSADARAAGLSFQQAVDRGFEHENLAQYFLNPMQYVQANYAPVAGTTIAQIKSSSSVAVKLSEAELVAARRSARVARATPVRVAIADPFTPVPQLPIAQSSSSTSSISASVSASSAAATIVKVATPAVPPTPVASVSFEVPYQFETRSWQKFRVTLRDVNGDSIKNPVLDSPLYLRTAYGKADFRPSVLTASNFKNGSADVEFLPLGTTTVVIEMPQQNVQSQPIRYAGRQ